MEQAFYRFEAKIVSRGSGQSLVAAAAYRNGERMHDERTGLTYDFPRKERIDHHEVIAPDDAPDWARDAHRLSNAVEAAEKRRDAQLSRDVLVSLTHELGFEDGLEAVRGFARSEFLSRGYVVQITSHGYKPDPVTAKRNWHFHLLITERPLVAGKWAPVKDRARNSFRQLYRWRRRAAYFINAALMAAGKRLRVEYRSAADLGREPVTSRLPFGIWKRAEKAAAAARRRSLEAGVMQAISAAPAPMPAPALGSASRTEPALAPARLEIVTAPLPSLRPAPHTATPVPAGVTAKLGDAAAGLWRGIARVAEVGVELGRMAAARVEEVIAAQEQAEEQIAVDAAAAREIAAARLACETEAKAARDREDRLLMYRDELFDIAGKHEARRAYARVWKAGALHAVLVEGRGYADYGPDVDAQALRALVEAGGSEFDIYQMAGRSPYARILPDAEAVRRHTSRVIAKVKAEPKMAELLDKAAVAHAERYAASRPRPQPARPWVQEAASDHLYNRAPPALGHARGRARKDDADEALERER